MWPTRVQNLESLAVAVAERDDVSCCFSFCGGFIRICLCSIFRGNGFASQFCYVGYCVVGLVNLILADI